MQVKKNFCTLDDLLRFCQENNFTRFSSREHDNQPLIIQSIEQFEVADNITNGLLPVKLKACHIGENRNRSTISEENMRKYMASFKGRPILGAIYKTDTGEYEFRSHDMQVVIDDDETYIEYKEQPVGVVSEIEEPYLEYDEEQDKTYLMVSGNIYEDYSRAAEILQRRRTCKCSVEIAVDEMSWDAKNDVLSIDVFTFRGVTILGYEQDGVTAIEEGMVGSKITIDSFSERNNSVFGMDYQAKLLETLDRLNETLSRFSINNANKEGSETDNMNHFEELLEAYEITEEEIDFEIEGLSDEELDATFEEHFGKCKKNVKCDEGGGEGSTDGGAEGGAEGGTEGGPEGGTEEGGEAGEGTDPDDGEGEESGEADEDDEGSESGRDEGMDEGEDGKDYTDTVGDKKKKYSVDDNGNICVSYELSHDDIRGGIYSLLYAEDADADCWIIEVFETYFIYESWPESKYFRRGYSVADDNVSLAENKEEVFSEWLSQSEKDALDALKQSYAELKEFKDNIELAECRSQKQEILDRDEFSVIATEEKFVQLKDNIDNLSLAEVETQAKNIFADYVIKNGNFNMNQQKTTHKKVDVVVNKPNKKKAYGNLFD